MFSTMCTALLKSWDSSIDVVNVLKHEIRDGQLSFRGKRVLEVCIVYLYGQRCLLELFLVGGFFLIGDFWLFRY